MTLEDVLPSGRKLFRTEIEDDPSEGFDRNEQLQINAKCLDVIRTTWPEAWDQVAKTLDKAVRTAPEYRGVREMKLRIADLIRKADESADYRRTVAFVSKGVLRAIAESAGVKPKIGALGWKKFAHEHGVPVDVIARILVDQDNHQCDIYATLEAMSCRSLLLSVEAKKIDERFKSSLPGNVKISNSTYPMGRLPLRFAALARYHAADPQLIGELVPISSRGTRLLKDFKSLVNGRSSNDIVTPQIQAEQEQKTNDIAYVPDTVFDYGMARKSRHRAQLVTDLAMSRSAV